MATKKKGIKIPQPQAELLRAYLGFEEMARKQGLFLSLRSFIDYAIKEGRTEEKNGAIGLKKGIKFIFED